MIRLLADVWWGNWHLKNSRLYGCQFTHRPAIKAIQTAMSIKKKNLSFSISFFIVFALLAFFLVFDSLTPRLRREAQTQINRGNPLLLAALQSPPFYIYRVRYPFSTAGATVEFCATWVLRWCFFGFGRQNSGQVFMRFPIQVYCSTSEKPPSLQSS